jgi:hypothetical protein
MPTLIQKQRELFDKTMHKYICSCVIDNIEKCPRTETVRHFLTTCLIEHYEEDRRELEGKYKDEKVCAYCLDTKWMKVNNGHGNYKNQPCVWCRDGKEKLENDQLVHSGIEWNAALDLAISLLQDKIKELKK